MANVNWVQFALTYDCFFSGFSTVKTDQKVDFNGSLHNSDFRGDLISNNKKQEDQPHWNKYTAIQTIGIASSINRENR